MFKKIIFTITICFSILSYSQIRYSKGSSEPLIDESSNYILNKPSLQSFYDKLTTEQSTTIVHIGDSHIQGNAFSGRLRSLFQDKYGKSSRGIVFPLRLSKTNGHHDIRFYSNISWDHFNITTPKKGKKCGISGATIQTTKPKFYIKLKNKGDLEISSVKIIGKGLEKLKFGIANKKIAKPKKQYKSTGRIYKVKQGDYLGKIASKFKTTVKNLRRWNNLKSNSISINQKLRIKKGSKTIYKAQKIDLNDFNLIDPTTISDNEVTIDIDSPLKNLYIISDEDGKKSFTRIDGMFVNNYNKGVTYHSIGINGAKYVDYNKSTLFFEQLQNINPDLIIISLGTNESFFKRIDPKTFKNHTLEFIEKIKQSTGCQNILFTTPPTCYKKRKHKNTKLQKLTNVLIDIANKKNHALWNLFEVTGKEDGVKKWFKKGLMARDKIHYSSLGYKIQAEKLFEVLKHEDDEISKIIEEVQQSNN